MKTLEIVSLIADLIGIGLFVYGVMGLIGLFILSMTTSLGLFIYAIIKKFMAYLLLQK